MLTASLQSTWEAQRSKQRPKFGNPYHSNVSYEEMDSKMNEEKPKPTSIQHGYMRNGADASYASELPNLKIPQVILEIPAHHNFLK
jgi:hypothetical protein